MSRQDIVSLDRHQRADVFCAGGTLRRVADHPLNAPLIGLCGTAKVERSAELVVQEGDKTIVVHVSRAGRELRAASAVVRRRADGAVLLTEWQVEAGFAHRTQSAGGNTCHRIATASVAPFTTPPLTTSPLTTPAGAPATAPGRGSSGRTASR